MKNTILSFYCTYELSGISNDISELIIDGRNDLIGCIRIENYPELTSIQVNAKSLINVLSINIVNNPKLQTIQFGDQNCTHLKGLVLSSTQVDTVIIQIYLN